mmetsp:Transcript_15903/g.39327  ORF Transcript_15903/g.39327 Transcript_15903/m.39327 type:complete len:266 (-) Transcript_15903:11910-12707(-)
MHRRVGRGQVRPVRNGLLPGRAVLHALQRRNDVQRKRCLCRGRLLQLPDELGGQLRLLAVRQGLLRCRLRGALRGEQKLHGCEPRVLRPGGRFLQLLRGVARAAVREYGHLDLERGGVPVSGRYAELLPEDRGGLLPQHARPQQRHEPDGLPARLQLLPQAPPHVRAECHGPRPHAEPPVLPGLRHGRHRREPRIHRGRNASEGHRPRFRVRKRLPRSLPRVQHQLRSARPQLHHVQNPARAHHRRVRDETHGARRIHLHHPERG